MIQFIIFAVLYAISCVACYMAKRKYFMMGYSIPNEFDIAIIFLPVMNIFEFCHTLYEISGRKELNFYEKFFLLPIKQEDDYR